MNTYESLSRDLSRLGVEQSKPLIVHASYKAIGETEGRGETVIDSIIDYMSAGLLLLPSFTYDYVSAEHPVMNVKNTPSCVGVLPELFRKKDGIRRSLHPTHSVCGIGYNAAEFLCGDHLSDTPCGYETVYRRLYEHKGQILLIGVKFMENTFIHGVEEWYDVPGRLLEEHMPLSVVDYDGIIHSTPMRGYTHPFDSLKAFESEDAMIAIGAVTQGKFGNADCLLCDAKKLSDGLGEMIQAGRLY